MMKNLIHYELKACVLPFALLYTLSALIALSSRIASGSSENSFAGIVLMLILLPGTFGILAWRFFRTTFTAEAEFLYSVPVGAGGALFARAVASLFFSCASVLVLSAAFLLAGGEPGRLILSLRPLPAAVYFASVSLSILSSVFQLDLLLAVTGLSLFRPRQKFWISCFILLSFILDQARDRALRAIWPDQIFLSSDGAFQMARQLPAQLSLSFTPQGFVWSLVLIPVCYLLTLLLIRRYIIISE